MSKDTRAFGFTIASILGGFLVTFVILFMIVGLGGSYIGEWFSLENMGLWFGLAFLMTLGITGIVYRFLIERRAYAG